jgi:hypothetical protein
MTSELLALGLRMVAVGLFTFGRMPAAAEYIERARVCLGREREALESFQRGLALASQQGAVAYERRVEERVAALFQALGATTDEPPTLSGRM